jgi:hypothetical protein
MKYVRINYNEEITKLLTPFSEFRKYSQTGKKKRLSHTVFDPNQKLRATIVCQPK